MKILCTYKPIDTPWGGANNFLRALYAELRKLGVSITFDREDSFDLIFMNQLGPGRGQEREPYTLSEVMEIKAQNSKAPLVVRCVNLRRHSHPSLFYKLSKDSKKDKNTIAHIEIADFAIFQSQYQYDFFAKMGTRSKRYEIVHNGASSNFMISNPAKQCYQGQTLKLISSSFSNRATKRHDILADLSEIKNVEIKHIGAWPDKLNKKKVNCVGVIGHSAMMELFKESHYFVHPAVRDPCPNSMIEALCAGVPVLYNPGLGSGRELGEEHGLELDITNLQETINIAQRQYSKLVEELSNKRAHYSIECAAEKYLNCFRGAMVAG